MVMILMNTVLLLFAKDFLKRHKSPMGSIYNILYLFKEKQYIYSIKSNDLEKLHSNTEK